MNGSVTASSSGPDAMIFGCSANSSTPTAIATVISMCLSGPGWIITDCGKHPLIVKGS